MSQNPESPQTIQISHLQLLINAVVLAYHRKAYTLKEAGTIWKAVEHFTSQGAAMMPQVQKVEQEQQVPVQVPTKPTQPSTQVSPVTQAGQKPTETVHTIQPEEPKEESNLVLNIAEKN